MKIIRAEHLGMCFGVRDAIALAVNESRRQPITILGDLVHNPAVIRELRQQGVQIEHELTNVSTSTVMVTAHGASDSAKNHIRSRGHHVLEATCPLVHFAHTALAQLVNEGYHPIIIGQRNHVEVRGLTGDLKDHDIVLSEEDILNLQAHAKIGIVSQTTQPIDKVRRLVELIRERFPRSEVRFKDTVCQPTKQRQSAAAELASTCDVVIVIGGHQSNNTRELVETSRRHCQRVHQVETMHELKQDWFRDAEAVGITAGTSTPDATIEAVEEAIRSLSTKAVLSTNR
jgi:4-hydroxy-3-methylbut-2-enyl diphosphate reductase